MAMMDPKPETGIMNNKPLFRAFSHGLFSARSLTTLLLFAGFAAFARDRNALQFVVDGAHLHPHAEVAEQAPFNVSTGLTVEAWVRLKEYGANEFPPKWQALVTKGEAWGLTRYSNTNRVAFRTTGDGATHVLAGTEANEFTPGQWHHVAAVWDGSTKQLYIDGLLDISEAWDGPPDVNTFHVILGGNEEHPARVYEGDMDDVRVWSTGRNAAQIAAAVRRRPLGSEDGLLGYWRFESVSAGAVGVPDTSTNGHHGALYDIDAGGALTAGGVLVGAPLPGEYALRVDGVDSPADNTGQFVRLPDSTLFDFTDAMTVECDVYVSSSHSAWSGLVSKGSGAWRLAVDGDRTIDFEVTGLTPERVTSQTVLAADEWHHVAATWDGSSLVLLIDGEVDAWELDVSGVMAVDAGKRVLFGAQPGDTGVGYSFKGRLDNVRLWNTARSPQQIAANMSRVCGGHGPGLVGTWDFNEGGGDAVADGRLLTEPAADTLDFEGAAPGVSVTEDGVQVSADTGAFAVETNTGSDALRADTTGALVTLTRVDGHAFRLLSMAVANTADDAEPGTQVTFEGTLADGGGTVEQTVTLGAELDVTTVEFTGFSDLASVSWLQEATDHQFDTIVVHDVEGVAVGQLKADGVLANVPGNQRVPGAKVLAAPSPSNYALRFDGVDDYLQVTHADALDLYEFTFEAWVKPGAPSGGEFRTIMRKGDLGYGLAIDADGYLRYFVGDGAAENAVSSTGTVSDGEWQHVAVSVSPPNNTIQFYIDGEPAGEVEDGSVLTNTDDLVFGRQGLNTLAGYFNGDLTELRIWDHVRRSDTIAGFASRRLPTVMTGLIAYWDCNEGAGDMAADGTDNALNATLISEGGADLTTWTYGPAVPFREGQYCATFDGVDDYLAVPHDAALDAGAAMTIEAWVRPEANETEDSLRTIALKGDNNADVTGYGLALDGGGQLCFWVDANALNVLRSAGRVTNDVWQHVAVVVDGGTASFYINGQPAGTAVTATINSNTESLFIGRQGLSNGTARNHYKGAIDELRMWNTARAAGQIAASAMGQLPGAQTGLAAYWRFNDYADYLELDDDEKSDANALAATDVVGGLEAGLQNATVDAWQPGLYTIDWDGDYWDTPAFPAGLNLAPNPEAEGLWLGTVTIVQVADIRTARSDYAGVLAPTSDMASFDILFHVDGSGRTRLLKDVMLMRAMDEGDAQVDEADLDEDDDPRLVLLTDPTLISRFKGVVMRRGKLVGKRYGTVAYDFDGGEQPFAGGLGAGHAVQGRVVLPRTHPTNPFRHKYHPGHRNTSDINPDHGFEVRREITIEFADSIPEGVNPGGYGVDRLYGGFREVVSGLHKFPIAAEGTIALTRICDVGVLNE